MGPIAILFGVLLCLLGGGLYAGTGAKSVTALIPAFLGVALVALGFLARSEKLRMHVMHLAALLGLIGMAGGIAMLFRVDPAQRPEAFYGSAGMAVLCGVFLGLCVKSFLDARRRRKESEQITS